MYEVIFDEKVIDFLNKLSKKIRERIFNKIISTKTNPFRFFKRLKGRKDYRLRIGNYRVIADINSRSKRIQITIVGHRRDIYKKI